MIGQEALHQAARTSPARLYRCRRLPRLPAALVRPDGHFDLSRSLTTLDVLDGERRAGRVLALIWDVRGRIDYPSASEIRSLVTRFDRWERVAVLTGPDVQYAMARMAAMLSDGVAAVRTAQEALSWISRVEAGS